MIMQEIIKTENKYNNWVKRLKVYETLKKEKKIRIITNLEEELRIIREITKE